ncbi:hypothetical protein [Bifidobacterium panos]|uniref:Uncharacterized protein n=1 Tax=Bifidobacterium panos TaxID=2675321 RepID=A0ABX1SWZ4_9BIFI|nr:hypothetical protein [Bifidobacterium sp. DSM 109963]NMN02355.1 hypothetical protein [Bifidobacterium sp. DSM 109963]
MLFAMRYPELPEPWEEVSGHLPADEQDKLEAVVGCKLTYKDMTDDDVIRDGEATLPNSRRSYYVMGHRWVRLRNAETGEEYVLRLQSKMPESKEVYVSSVIVPFQEGRELSGSAMRRLPLAAIGVVYSTREIQGTININRALALGNASKTFDPLKPLEPCKLADYGFLARVGLQYEAIGEAFPDVDATEYMATLNETTPSNVRRWLSASRKKGLLAPVASGRRR